VFIKCKDEKEVEKEVEKEEYLCRKVL